MTMLTLLAINLAGENLIRKDKIIKLYTIVYKSLSGLAPNYLRSKFTARSNVFSHSLRDTNGNLAIPLATLEHFFGIAFPLSCGRRILFGHSGLAASNSLKDLSTRHLCKAGS